MEPTTIFSYLSNFVIGGLSGAVATCAIQPLDTLKVQMQVISQQIGKRSSLSLSLPAIFCKIKNEKGLSILYRGLDSAIYRQLVYGSARIGAYDSLNQFFVNKNKRNTTKLQKISISIVSGAFGAIVGNPFDVALIRRQASISNNRSTYKNTFDAFKTIMRTEGLASLWTGINITIVRVAIINLAQLAGRDIISQYIEGFNFSKQFHNNFVALSASALTAVISLPVDNIKVKLQKQDKFDLQYRGIADCLAKSIRREGLLRLWVGLPIYFARGTPHSFILIRTQLYLTEQWKNMQRKH